MRLGIHAEPRGAQHGNQEAFEAAEAMLGRTMAMTRHYFGWYEWVDTRFVQWSIAGGRKPLISWHAFAKGEGRPDARWADIASGVHDDRIREQARRVASLPGPVFFSFHHEPEDDIDSIGAQGKCGAGPSEFVAAFNHVQNLFELQEVNNVSWLVVLMAGTYAGGKGPVEDWLPPHVRLLGVDGYNRGPSHGRVRSFEEIMTPVAVIAGNSRRHWIVQETGTIEDPNVPGAKGAWIDEARVWARTQHQLRGICYSHVNAVFQGISLDYWIDSSASSLAAFDRLGKDQKFQTM